MKRGIQFITAATVQGFVDTNGTQPKVLLFTERGEHPVLYSRVADVFSGYVLFGQVHVSETAVLEQFGVDKGSLPMLMATRDKYTSPTAFEDEVGFTTLSLFVAEYLNGPAVPNVVQLNSNSYDTFFERQGSLKVVLFSEQRETPQLFRNLSVVFHNRFEFAQVDGSDNELLWRSQVLAEDMPRVVAWKQADQVAVRCVYDPQQSDGEANLADLCYFVINSSNRSTDSVMASTRASPTVRSRKSGPSWSVVTPNSQDSTGKNKKPKKNHTKMCMTVVIGVNAAIFIFVNLIGLLFYKDPLYLLRE